MRVLKSLGMVSAAAILAVAIATAASQKQTK